MDSKRIKEIKKLGIIAMFSDDDLMEKLVLKGGNAIDIVYNIAHRSSFDLDFSIENMFNDSDLIKIKDKIEKTLKKTFNARGYEPFDIVFQKKPEQIAPNLEDFWGGYHIEFKLIESDKYNNNHKAHDQMRKTSFSLGPNSKKKFNISISKFEYCEAKQEEILDEFTVYVYSPEMIVFEKLRAICQQMPEYGDIVGNTNRSARARDFFDIYTVLEQYSIDLYSEKNIKLIQNIFHAKRVPLNLIDNIYKYREYHRKDFAAVKDTVVTSYKLKDFDFYFDYVVEKAQSLKPLWEV